jgi:hypothetical protein
MRVRVGLGSCLVQWSPRKRQHLAAGDRLALEGVGRGLQRGRRRAAQQRQRLCA